MFFLLMCAICLAVLEKAKQDPTAGSTSIVARRWKEHAYCEHDYMQMLTER